MTRSRIGLGLLTLVALFTAISPYLADWNVTHIYNPRWPPHAKFHNGQTMAMAVLLGLSTLVFAWRKAGDRRTNVLAALGFAGLYWVSQLAANLYPGVGWTDPEFLKAGESLHQVAPQQVLDLVLFAILGLTAWLLWPRGGESGRG
jgi:hypothetical protein